MAPRAAKPAKPAKPAKAPKAPKPPKPWTRAEAGRYRSSDDRFSLESDGAGRWFVTDAAALDELGLARTTGPHPTLDAAKAAAEAAREAPTAESPLAARLAAAKDRPKAPTPLRQARRHEPSGREEEQAAAPASTAAVDPVPEPAAAPPTWLDELTARDPELATRARRLVTRLEREGIAEAESLVRRDLLGDRPAVATRLLARAVLAAIADVDARNPVAVAEAVAGVLAASRSRAGLPGWELRERDAPGGRDRPIRLTAGDLLDAAEDGATG